MLPHDVHREVTVTWGQRGRSPGLGSSQHIPISQSSCFGSLGFPSATWVTGRDVVWLRHHSCLWQLRGHSGLKNAWDWLPLCHRVPFLDSETRGSASPTQSSTSRCLPCGESSSTFSVTPQRPSSCGSRPLDTAGNCSACLRVGADPFLYAPSTAPWGAPERLIPGLSDARIALEGRVGSSNVVHLELFGTHL